MSVILAISWRNIWRQKRRTLLTMSTIAIGLALILVLKGLTDGTLQQMIDSTVRMGSGHVVIQQPEYLDFGGVERFLDADQVVAAEAWLREAAGTVAIEHVVRRAFVSGLASSADGSVGVRVVGIDPEQELGASKFPESITEGRFLESEDEGRALLGKGAARRLAVGIGDRVVLMAQGAHGELESVLVRVAGIVHLGLDEMDDALVVIPLSTAQAFLGLEGGAHQVSVILADARDSQPLAAAGARRLEGLEVLDWRGAHPELVDVIQLVGVRNILLGTVVFTLVAFLVFNTLLMAVLERVRELALLEAVGLVGLRRFVMVMYEALFITALASLLGLALGLGAHSYLATSGLALEAFTSEGFEIAGTVLEPVLYSHLSLGGVLKIVGLVFGMTLLLALPPARRAARPTQIGHLGRN